jgi:hypothetical protein
MQEWRFGSIQIEKPKKRKLVSESSVEFVKGVSDAAIKLTII